MDVNQQQLGKLFMPYAMRTLETAQANQVKFVHYTSADTATRIIRNEEVWLRNSLVMNDFSEVQHGVDCLISSWTDPDLGGRLKAVLEAIEPGFVEEFEATFDAHKHEREVQSFIMSVSEHGIDGSQEDDLGRLSMWRAYGGDTNVAIVFDSAPFYSEVETLFVISTPVLYADKEGFKDEFRILVEGLEKELPLLQSIGKAMVLQYLFWAFHLAALSTKHPGFAEEREWRVIYSPSVFGNSDLVNSEIETVAGVPQKVIKVPLKPDAEKNYEGYPIANILEKIIVGPTETPWPIYESLALLLEEKGVEDPYGKVTISEIPLRR